MPCRTPSASQWAFTAGRQPARENVTPYLHELRLQANTSNQTGFLRQFSDRPFFRFSAGRGRSGGNRDLFLQDTHFVRRQAAGDGQSSARRSETARASQVGQGGGQAASLRFLPDPPRK